MGLLFLFFLVVKLCFAQDDYDYSALIDNTFTAQYDYDYRDSFARIITNLEEIYGSHGVPVDFSYNETGSHLISVPGCPKSIDGFPWVYYGNPPRCFLAFHNGPCPLEQKLILQAGSEYGICVCDCIQDIKKFETFQRSNARYMGCKGPAKVILKALQEKVYDRVTGKCYKLFQEYVDGPCPNGTVVAKYTRSALTCLPLCHFYDFNSNNTCAYDPPSSGYYPSHIDTRPCSSNHRYSEILKKCVLISKARVG